MLLLRSFTGTEAFSEPFSYRLEMFSAEDFIDPIDLLGKSIDFSVRLADDSQRHFNGIVSRFEIGDRETGYRRYFAEIVPWLWLLKRRADCRIFQEHSVPEIFEEVFLLAGLEDFDTSEIKGSHPKHEYRVQYRETDFGGGRIRPRRWSRS